MIEIENFVQLRIKINNDLFLSKFKDSVKNSSKILKTFVT